MGLPESTAFIFKRKPEGFYQFGLLLTSRTCSLSCTTALIRDSRFISSNADLVESGSESNTIQSFGLGRLYRTNLSQFVSYVYFALFISEMIIWFLQRYFTYRHTCSVADDLSHVSATTSSFSILAPKASNSIGLQSSSNAMFLSRQDPNIFRVALSLK